MNIPQQATDAVTRVATAATYGGSAGAVFFGLTANEFAALSGVVIAVIGLAVNVYYKAQHLRIAREKRQADPRE